MAKYIIEVTVDDEAWYNTPELVKRHVFLANTRLLKGSPVGQVRIESLSGAPHGFYLDSLGDIYRVESGGTYRDGDSWPTNFEYVSEYGPYLYLGYDRSEELS